MTDIQGLAKFNPKKKHYSVKIGNLFFPFSNFVEVYEYLLRRIKKT